MYIVMLVIGFLIGGVSSAFVISVAQIKRVKQYEYEIGVLKQKIEEYGEKRA